MHHASAEWWRPAGRSIYRGPVACTNRCQWQRLLALPMNATTENNDQHAVRAGAAGLLLACSA
eukprot:7383864-Prymnesium_polylepis.5